MDHIVAVELENREEHFFLTRGRIQDKVAPEPLEQLVLRHTIKYDLGEKPIKARLCRTPSRSGQCVVFL